MRCAPPFCSPAPFALSLNPQPPSPPNPVLPLPQARPPIPLTPPPTAPLHQENLFANQEQSWTYWRGRMRDWQRVPNVDRWDGRPRRVGWLPWPRASCWRCCLLHGCPFKPKQPSKPRPSPPSTPQPLGGGGLAATPPHPTHLTLYPNTCHPPHKTPPTPPTSLGFFFADVSITANRNLAAFADAWAIPLNATTRAALAPLPAWNFDPTAPLA